MKLCNFLATSVTLFSLTLLESLPKADQSHLPGCLVVHQDEQLVDALANDHQLTEATAEQLDVLVVPGQVTDLGEQQIPHGEGEKYLQDPGVPIQRPHSKDP